MTFKEFVQFLFFKSWMSSIILSTVNFSSLIFGLIKRSLIIFDLYFKLSFVIITLRNVVEVGNESECNFALVSMLTVVNS